LEDRWVHFFDASMIGHCESGGLDCYNINSQRFDTRMYDGTEHRGSPNAGAAAWPDPIGGNWSKATAAILETTLTTLSDVASVSKGVTQIIDAYNDKPFDTERTDKIEFKADYSAYTRETVSHSVNFTADQVPNTSGMVDILSAAGDNGASYETSSWVYLYPEHDDISKNPPSASSTGTLRDTLDTMSQEKLAEYGIQRVKSSEVDEQTRRSSRFNIGGDQPSYIKSFNMDVEFGAENGSVVKGPQKKK